jgi:hypothetical protein
MAPILVVIMIITFATLTVAEIKPNWSVITRRSIFASNQYIRAFLAVGPMEEYKLAGAAD